MGDRGVASEWEVGTRRAIPGISLVMSLSCRNYGFDSRTSRPLQSLLTELTEVPEDGARAQTSSTWIPSGFCGNGLPYAGVRLIIPTATCSAWSPAVILSINHVIHGESALPVFLMTATCSSSLSNANSTGVRRIYQRVTLVLTISR
jgi:hypothetical protein